MQVNEQVIRGMVHKEAAAHIKKATGTISLTFHRPNDPLWLEKLRNESSSPSNPSGMDNIAEQ